MAFKLDNFGADSSNAKGTLGGVCYYRYRNEEGDSITTAGYFPALLGLQVGDRITVIPQDLTTADKVYAVTSIANRTVEVEEISSGGGSAVIEELNVIPSTSAQTITAPTGTDGYSPVNVSAVTSSIDANIQAGNIKDGVTILGVTGTYTGGGSSGRYSLMEEITDDSNTKIGRVVGFTKDNNYAIVCLYAKDRIMSTALYGSLIFNTPTEKLDLDLYAPDNPNTENTAIDAYIPVSGTTSPARTACSSISYTVGGVTYGALIPTLYNLIQILSCATAFDSYDPTLSSYTGQGLCDNVGWYSCMCTQASSKPTYAGLNPSNFGIITTTSVNSAKNFAPVIQLPNTAS